MCVILLGKEVVNVVGDEMVGKRYGRYIVTGYSGGKKVHCRCNCGTEKDVDIGALRRGDTMSCGCYRSDRLTTHGLYHTKLHDVWYGMLQRCNYDKHIDHEWYKERGIAVCDEWRNNFKAFYDWAMDNGYKEGLSLDRIDNDRGYSPDNCRFATPKEQANNRSSNLRFELNGVTKTLKQWTEEYGLNYHTVYCRIKRGVPLAQALTH